MNNIGIPIIDLDSRWFQMKMYEAELRGYVIGEKKRCVLWVEAMKANGYDNREIARCLICADIEESALCDLIDIKYSEVLAIEDEIGKHPRKFGDVFTERIDGYVKMYTPRVILMKRLDFSSEEIAECLLDIDVDQHAIKKMLGLTYTAMDDIVQRNKPLHKQYCEQAFELKTLFEITKRMRTRGYSADEMKKWLGDLYVSDAMIKALTITHINKKDQ